MGFLSFLKNRRRRKILAADPIERNLWERTLSALPILKTLSAAEAERLRDACALFLSEKEFHAVGGLILNESMRLTIAAQACLPILELGIDWYDDWSSIFVTPTGYRDLRGSRDNAGVVHEYEEELAGEVLELGPVVLSWDDVRNSGRGSGYNVVIHEMAHKIDGRGGELDGVPPLARAAARGEWRVVFSSAYDDLAERITAWHPNGRRRRPPAMRTQEPAAVPRRPRIDPYALESPAEFFAVLCEYFFEVPRLLALEYPEVHRLLADFFGRRTDP